MVKKIFNIGNNPIDNKEKISKLKNIDSIINKELHSKNAAIKITFIYVAVAGLWVTFSDNIIKLYTGNAKTAFEIQMLKGWIYVFLTGILLFILINRNLKEVQFWTKELINVYSELEAAYEELTATEEELRAQYDELQSNEEIIRKSEERYRLAIDGVNDVIWEWNLETNEFFISDKMEDIVGGKLENPLNIRKTFNELVHPNDKNFAIKAMRSYIDGKSDLYQEEFRIKCLDGSYKWIYNRGKGLKNFEGKFILLSGSLTDITQKKNNEEKIIYLAYYDTLTGLPNRSFLMEKLVSVLNSEDPKGGLIFLDLDDFKKINDTIGHNMGDEVLKVVSKKLVNFADENMTVSRMSGDEFIILVSGVSDEVKMGKLASDILNIFDKPFDVRDSKLDLSASLGLTLFPQDGTDGYKLLQHSDAAMYSAKQKGKNRYVFFDRSITDDIKRRADIERELRIAIQNNELEVFFQPQVFVKSGNIKSLESLLRWNNKKLGQVSPVEFIPIAEDTGLINTIGEFVLKEVCRYNQKWKKKGYSYDRISVNVSTVQLEDPHFINNLLNICRKEGINPESIELEITENVLINDINNKLELFKKLRNLGFKIALDDFGTGYSSLNYLRVLPINTLKIDKKFTDNICNSESDKFIMECMINLAHSMDIKVVVEGVEDAHQVVLLKEMNCDIIQGYYYYKPLPSEKIERLLCI